MGQPQSVKDQAKKADDLIKAQANQGTDEGTPPKVEVEPAKAPVVEPVVVDPVPVVHQPVIPVKGTEDFEQKYRVIKGKYDTEIPALRDQVEGLTEQVRKFMENKPNEPAKTPENFDEALAEMTEQYGEQFASIVNNAAEEKATVIAKEIAKDIANQIVDERLKELNGRVDTVSEVQVQTASEKFYANLDSGLPSWRTINTDPPFLAWLSKPIDAELGGETYMDKLKASYGSLNDSMVLTIFNRYLKLNPDATKSNTSNLEELIVPDDKGGADDLTNLNAEKKKYSQAEINQFYTDSAAGKYKDRPEEKARMEADIFAAQSDGRIT